ncbi:MAG: tetratricopeptide repeat protein [Cyclobacteriaceae bacterium]|nr:tetratricopeptide repeat protein [Cyclobacteriaceae bacterium HetDA_MAG_MS6]
MRYSSIVLIGAITIYSCTDSLETRRDRFFLQGNQALDHREFDKAISFYDKSLELDTEFAEAYNNRGVAKVEDGRHIEAIQDYNQALLRRPGYWECLHNRAMAYEKTRKFEKSLDDLNRLTEQFPDSAISYFSKGLVYTSMRAFQIARQEFTKALNRSPNDVETLINIGTTYYYQNHYDSAEYYLGRALLFDRNAAQARSTLSQVLTSAGKASQGFLSITLALAKDPENPYFLNNRGFVYLVMDSLNAALKDINNSILKDPSNMWAYRNKGLYHLKKKEYDEAARLLTKAAKSDVIFDEIYSYLGEALWHQGNEGDACKQWQKGSTQYEKNSSLLLSRRCL